MKLGGNGVLPFKIGGIPAPHELVYKELRAAIGQGLEGPAGSIVEAWRAAKARGIAAVYMDRRASLQASPLTATVGLPVFERLTGQVFGSTVSEQERRDLLCTAWIGGAGAMGAALASAVESIVPGAEIFQVDRDLTRETQHGRAFEDWDPSDPDASGPAFNLSQKGTMWPNYSTDMVFLVGTNIAGVPSLDERRKIEALKTELFTSLPAWVDFTIFSTVGFVLDEDLLDLTAFGE